MDRPIGKMTGIHPCDGTSHHSVLEDADSLGEPHADGPEGATGAGSHTSSWVPLRSKVKLATLVVVIACSACLAVPVQALALWPVDGDGSVLVGFHETYVSSSGEHTHYGVDCSAEAGSSIYAPASGTVSFVGQVPAGDTSGCGTMTAVSIEMDDGDTLTLMPFETEVVQEGDSVSVGQLVGTLASSGDKSSSAVHLHVGLKDGDVYMDPSYLLGLESEGSSSKSGGSAETVLALEAGSLAEQVQEASVGETLRSAETLAASDVAGVSESVTAVSGAEEVQDVSEISTNTGSVIVDETAASYSISSTLADGATPAISSQEETVEEGIFQDIASTVAEFADTTVTNLADFYSSIGIPSWALWASAALVASGLLFILDRERIGSALGTVKAFWKRTGRTVQER